MPVAEGDTKARLERIIRMKSSRILFALFIASTPVYAGTLHGSRASQVRQHRIAKRHDYKFLRTAAEVHEWVKQERLVTFKPTADYSLSEDVSFPPSRLKQGSMGQAGGSTG